MNKVIGLLFAGVLFFAAVSLHAEVITEGAAEGYAQGPEVTNSATLYFKGNKARLFPKSNAGMPVTNGLPLLDYDNLKMILISDKEKYYMEMPLAPMENNLTNQPLKLVSTGKKSEYLKVNIEEFKGTEKETGAEIIAYGTKDVVSKINPLIAFQRISKDGLALSKAGRALQDMGYFPVRIQALKSGKVFFFWEIRSIDPKKVDASMMEIPAGYLKFADYMKKKNRVKSGR